MNQGIHQHVGNCLKFYQTHCGQAEREIKSSPFKPDQDNRLFSILSYFKYKSSYRALQVRCSSTRSTKRYMAFIVIFRHDIGKLREKGGGVPEKRLDRSPMLRQGAVKGVHGEIDRVAIRRRRNKQLFSQSTHFLFVIPCLFHGI